MIGFLVLASCLSFAIPASSQSTIPEFEVDMVQLRSAEETAQTRVDLYTKIPYSRLRFINSPEGFTANYQTSAQVVAIDESGRRRNVVQNPLWDRTVTVSAYSETGRDDAFDYTTYAVNLDPGSYIVEFQLEDRSSRESFVFERLLEVRDLSASASISDLLLIDEFDRETNTIFPNISRSYDSDTRSLRIFYELYADEARPLTVEREIIMVGDASASLQRDIDLAAIVESDSKRIAYNDLERTSGSVGRFQHIVELPVDRLAVGNYVAVARVKAGEDETIATVAKPFVVNWGGLTAHIQDIDQAVRQLKYIAKGKEIQTILAASNTEQTMERFKAFWQKRDPTPGTTRNERMEEYYYRVAFANQRYGTFTDGWQTDRGQVMVLFGEPDHIDRHTYNFSVKPYEVWYYYQLGRRFIFIDQTGLGDFELKVPIWDDTTRLR